MKYKPIGRIRTYNIKLGHQECEFRRSNNQLRFWGIPEGAEKAQSVAHFLHQFISSFIIPLPKYAITNVRRVGDFMPRDIVVDFQRSVDTEAVLSTSIKKKLKVNGSIVRIDRNYPYAVFKERRKLRPILETMLNTGMTAYFDYDELKYIKDGQLYTYKYAAPVSQHDPSSLRMTEMNENLSINLGTRKANLPTRSTKKIKKHHLGINPSSSFIWKLYRERNMYKRHRERMQRRQTRRDYKVSVRQMWNLRPAPVIRPIRSRQPKIPRKVKRRETHDGTYSTRVVGCYMVVKYRVLDQNVTEYRHL